MIDNTDVSYIAYVSVHNKPVNYRVCENVLLFICFPSSASHRKAIVSVKNGRVVNSLITLMESESEKVCLTVMSRLHCFNTVSQPDLHLPSLQCEYSYTKLVSVKS